MILTCTAALLRAWAGAALGVVLAWAGAMQLRGEDIVQAQWIDVLLAVLLLATAEASQRLVLDRRWWVRADWPLLALAHVTALLALVGAGTGSSLSLTYVAVGLVAIAFAARIRARVPEATSYAVLGTALVLVGAGSAGPGWLALALAVVSVAC